MADISIRSVGKSYGKTAALRDVSLAIRDGEFVVFLGPSGCGKSTLLRMIAGLETISSGTILIDGDIGNDVEPRSRGCAMVFQNYALYPHMTVAENIGYALNIARIPKAELTASVRNIATKPSLESLLDRRQLSGGSASGLPWGGQRSDRHGSSCLTSPCRTSMQNSVCSCVLSSNVFIAKWGQRAYSSRMIRTKR